MSLAESFLLATNASRRPPQRQAVCEVSIPILERFLQTPARLPLPRGVRIVDVRVQPGGRELLLLLADYRKDPSEPRFEDGSWVMIVVEENRWGGELIAPPGGRPWRSRSRRRVRLAGFTPVPREFWA